MPCETGQWRNMKDGIRVSVEDAEKLVRLEIDEPHTVGEIVE